MGNYEKNRQYFKFCGYGFLKNLRFFDAFFLLFFLENGVTFTQIGILYATREIVINAAEIPSGIIADTYGRKNSLIAALLSYIISFVFFYFSSDFYFFLFAIALFGIGDAFRSGTHKGMIMDYLKLNNWENHKVDYYGHTRSWSQKGSAISSLIAGVMVLYSGGYRVIFIFSIIPYLLNFINIYTYPNELNFSLSKKKKHDTHSFLTVLKIFWMSIKNPRVLQVINSAALHSAYLKATKDYIQPMMLQIVVLLPILGMMDTKRKSGLIIGIIYFFIFILTSQASKNSSKILNLKIKNISRNTLLLGLGAGAICGFLFGQKLWVAALVAFIFIYLLENIRKPILTGELADNVPNEILTSVLSAQSFFQTFMTSLLAILLGIFADEFGIGTSLIIISTFLMAYTIAIGALGTKKIN